MPRQTRPYRPQTRPNSQEEREEALTALADQVDGAFGDAGVELGQQVRSNGGIPLLSWLLADPAPEVQQTSLMILGNLCSDSVDTNSCLTKQLLLTSGGARATSLLPAKPTTDRPDDLFETR